MSASSRVLLGCSPCAARNKRQNRHYGTRNVTQPSISVIKQLNDVQAQIRQHASTYGRDPNTIELLAVSKRKSASVIQEAVNAGQTSFGENYVDEALEKIKTINNASISWHFIGTIQSRKTADIAQHFDWAHSVDREKIATRLSTQRPPDLPPLDICLQINTDNESTKAGIPPEQAMSLADTCARLPGINLRGLMAIPAPRNSLKEQRHVFRDLKQCFDTLKSAHPTIDTLSIGMSQDLEAAIAEGATIVRIGTAIFGARE